MKKTILAILMAVALIVIPVGNALAASSVDVTVTASPAVISLTVLPTTWDINDEVAGDGLVRINTTYYANPTGDETAPNNPVVDGDCRFTFTNDGTVNIDIACDFADFTSGDAMQNSEGGYTVNGANDFGASGYASGAAWPGGAVDFLSTGSAEFIDDLAVSGTIMWGAAILMQSGDFVSAVTMDSTITCTATEHV